MGVANTNLWNSNLIAKYDVSGPRYTSYPTALQFCENFGLADWKQVASQSNSLGTPLSLYFHIPFCDTVCYYCACNRIVTANKKVADPYIKNVLLELELQGEYIDSDRIVHQMHWGGGTPTFITDEQIETILEKAKTQFHFLDNDEGEYSIEIHPAFVDTHRINNLRKLGFNRLSMGIQDFDPSVQRAVNRFNSIAEVERLVKAAHDARFKSISMDLIYGLPHQTCESFAKTIQHIIALDPNRISLFNYAHLPHLFKTQRQIDSLTLPEPQEKLSILHQTISQLLDAGYVYIGMDHFAKPDDELAIAQREGKLHRNFQGYSTHNDCDMLAFGVTAISSVGDTIFQNVKSLVDYSDSLDKGKIPIFKGVVLSQDDKIRKALINELICNFYVGFGTIERCFDIKFSEYFSEEISELSDMQSDGLLSLTSDAITIKKPGRMLVRSICMVFDKYAQSPQKISPQYSRII